MPHVPNHVLSLGFHSIPFQENQEVQYTKYVGEEKGQFQTSEKPLHFSDIYDHHGKHVLIRLLEADPAISGFKTHREIQLKGSEKVLVSFSKTGKFFAIYMQEV